MFQTVDLPRCLRENLQPGTWPRKFTLPRPRHRLRGRDTNMRPDQRPYLHLPQKTLLAPGPARIPHPPHAPRWPSSPHRLTDLRLDDALWRTLDSRRHRSCDLRNGSDHRLPVRADLCCRCVHTVCGECDGGSSFCEDDRRVRIPAFCGEDVRCHGAGLGEFVAFLRFPGSGCAGAVGSVEVWRVAEEQKYLLCWIVLTYGVRIDRVL